MAALVSNKTRVYFKLAHFHNILASVFKLPYVDQKPMSLENQMVFDALMDRHFGITQEYRRDGLAKWQDDRTWRDVLFEYKDRICDKLVQAEKQRKEKQDLEDLEAALGAMSVLDGAEALDQLLAGLGNMNIASGVVKVLDVAKQLQE